VFEHLVNTPFINSGQDAFDLPWILNRLGELYEQKRDIAKAVTYYRQFIDLWKTPIRSCSRRSRRRAPG